MWKFCNSLPTALLLVKIRFANRFYKVKQIPLWFLLDSHPTCQQRDRAAGLCHSRAENCESSSDRLGKSRFGDFKPIFEPWTPCWVSDVVGNCYMFLKPRDLSFRVNQVQHLCNWVEECKIPITVENINTWGNYLLCRYMNTTYWISCCIY